MRVKLARLNGSGVVVVNIVSGCCGLRMVGLIVVRVDG